MNLLQDPIRPLYFKYLAAAFGSSMLAAIYSLVDIAMVGQYQGPDGPAALAVVFPIWTIIYSLGLLTGIGGSILYSAERGQGSGQRQNQYFTAALLLSILLAALSWAVILFLDDPLLRFFGADEVLMPLAKAYLFPVKFAIPCFLFSQMLAAFLRNDGRPALATGAVIAGGVFNVFGDYFFVFVVDWGILGAGLATAIGSALSCVVMLTHFFSKKNTLRVVKPSHLLAKFRGICTAGFSSFFVDLAMGVIGILFNRQIMAYLGSDALAVYGVLVNVSTLVQCCAYSVGQAAQPILSQNYGAKLSRRIRTTLSYALYTVAFFGLLWTAVTALFPTEIIRLFMTPTEGVLASAPFILRAYGLSFLLLPFNVFSTYYFQSVMRPSIAFGVSVARGLVVSAALILLLPALLGGQAVWFAMPVTELLVALGVAGLMRKTGKAIAGA